MLVAELFLEIFSQTALLAFWVVVIFFKEAVSVSSLRKFILLNRQVAELPDRDFVVSQAAAAAEVREELSHRNALLSVGRVDAFEDEVKALALSIDRLPNDHFKPRLEKGVLKHSD